MNFNLKMIFLFSALAASVTWWFCGGTFHQIGDLYLPESSEHRMPLEFFELSNESVPSELKLPSAYGDSMIIVRVPTTGGSSDNLLSFRLCGLLCFMKRVSSQDEIYGQHFVIPKHSRLIVVQQKSDLFVLDSIAVSCTGLALFWILWGQLKKQETRQIKRDIKTGKGVRGRIKGDIVL